MSVFLSWLTGHNVKGDIGEIGVPRFDDAYAYARLLQAFYDTITGHDVWVSAWLASENFPNHALAAYHGDNFQVDEAATPLTTRTMVGRVIEQNLSAHWGINLGNTGENGMFGGTDAIHPWSNSREDTGWAFGTGGLVVAAPDSDPYQGGNYVKQWNYGSTATWEYLASRGITHVRLPFRSERIYRTMGGSLDTTEVGRITDALDDALANGISVVLDCHNFGYHYVDNGTWGDRTNWTDGNFADMWAKLVAAFDAHGTVVGYDLMNEPVGMSSWRSTTSQAAVTAIRNAGSTKTVVVEFPGFAHPEEVSGTPWITDPANNTRYSVHCYLDYASNKSSSYSPGGSQMGVYALNLANCKTAGYSGVDTSPTHSVDGAVIDWSTKPNTPALAALGCTDDEVAGYIHNSRGDGGTPVTHDGGFDWQVFDGAAQNYNCDQSAAYVNAGTYDCVVSTAMKHVGTNGGGLWLRGSDDGSLGIAVDIGGIYTVDRTVSPTATYTSLATWSSQYTHGDTLEARLEGTTITITRIRLGVRTQIAQVTSSFQQHGLCHGLWCFNESTTRTTWSNLVIYDLLAPNVDPTASFNSGITDAIQIHFTSTSLDTDGAISYWIWDFGDGNSSTEAEPYHLYAAEGTYTVTLTVFDNRGAQATVVQDVEAVRPL